MKTICFIGQAPARSGCNDPLAGYKKRMSETLGISEQGFLSFDRFNLLRAFSGKNGKGDSFDLPMAKVRARDLLPLLIESYDKVVLMGRNVGRAFNMNAGHFQKMRMGSADFIIFPHPSGINLWWNDAAKVKAGKRRLRNFLWETSKQL